MTNMTISHFASNIRKLAAKLLHKFQAKYYEIATRFSTDDFTIIGITGTSGKTTTSSMLYHVLHSSGYKVGLISTVSAIINGQEVKTGLHVTTPDSRELYGLLGEMKKEGVKIVIIEVSSHALDQERLGNIQFDYAIFTNIKGDHLDWHKTWESYALAKSKLITKCKRNGSIIINAFDTKAAYLLINIATRNSRAQNMIMYDYNNVSKVISDFSGVQFQYLGVSYKIPIIGEYNIENALAVITTASSLGLQNTDIINGLSLFTGVKGRMDIMQRKPFTIIVNFAHNADSLEKSIKSIKRMKNNNSKLITVFGSAGLRDTAKRTDMGYISGKYSDITIITAEDPRTEKLSDINNEIITGAVRAGGQLIKRFSSTKEVNDFSHKVTVKINEVFVFDEDSVNSRYDAIRFALQIANNGDIVLIEGKGHEESLCFGKIETPYSDYKAVETAINILTPKNK